MNAAAQALNTPPVSPGHPLPRQPWWLRGNVLSRVALGAAALVLLRLAIGMSYEWQLFQEAEITDVKHLASLLEGQAGHTFESIDEVMVARAAMLAAQHGQPADPARLSAVLDPLPASNHIIRSLSLVDAHGRVLASSAPAQVGRVIVLAQIALPATGAAGQLGPLVDNRDLQALVPAPSGPGQTADLARISLLMGREASPPGQPKRYLVAALGLDLLGRSFAPGLTHPGLNAALLSSNGEMIAGTPGLAALVGRAATPRAAANRLTARGNYSQTTGPGLQGSQVFAASRALHDFPLAVVVEQDQELARGVQLSGRLLARSIGDLLALLVVAAAWLILRKQGEARDAMATALILKDDKLQQSEEATRLILESVRELIFRADAMGYITFVNRSWVTSTGYAEDELLGRHLADLVEPEDRTRVEALFRPTPGAPADPVRVRLRGRRELLSLELSVTPLAASQHSELGFAGIAFDLTERQTVRERLQDRLDFAMRLVEVSPAAIYAKDVEGRYIEVNRAFLELFDLSLQQVLGKTSASLFADPDGRQKAADAHVLSTGETVSYEDSLAGPDGRMRYTRVTKSLLKYGNGKPAGIIGSTVDVSVYRQAEQAIREARDSSVRTARAKLQFERGFLSMAAHELRTPLTSLRLQAELIADAPSDAHRRSSSKDVLTSVDRIGHVLEQLMILSRVDGLRYSELDLVSVDMEAVYFKVMSPLQEEAAERGIRMRSQLRGCFITGVEFGLYTLMRNLLHNAILYTPEGGKVSIEARNVDGAEVLTVDDSGPGIPIEQRERAFDRFNRLGQQKVKGSGLGLSIVKTITALHGAVISLASSELGGLRVEVRFPHDRPAVPQFLDSGLLDMPDTVPGRL